MIRKLIHWLLTLGFSLGMFTAAQETTIPLSSPAPMKVLERAGGVASTTFSVPASTSLMLRVFPYADEAFTLILPDGSSLTETNAAALGWEITVVNPEDTVAGQLLAPARTLLLMKEQPQPGDYQLSLSLTEDSADELLAQVLSVGGAIRTAFIVGDPSEPGLFYDRGKPLFLAVGVFDNAQPVLGLDVSVSADEANGPGSASVTLRDDGQGFDSTADDGIYSGSVVLEELGTWWLYAQIEGQSAVGQPLSLRQARQISIAPADTRLSGEVSDRGVDTDGDGRFDFIEVEFGTVSPRTGDVYVISAVLRDSSGSQVWVINSVSAEEPLTLSFPVLPIHPAEVDPGDPESLSELTSAPPYEIAEVRFNVETTLQGVTFDRLLSYLPKAGQTRAYSEAELERSNTIISPSFSEEAVDVDGNGKFDHLTVTLELDLFLAGSYGISAQLRAQDRTFLASAAVPSISLQQGVQQVTLRFPGVKIGEAGLDGPYEIAELLIYPNFRSDERSTVGIKDVLGLTGPYSHTEFEGSRNPLSGIPGLIDYVSRMEIDSPAESAEALRQELINALTRAQEELDAGRTQQARNQLNAFGNKISAQRGKAILDVNAQFVLEELGRIENSL